MDTEGTDLEPDLIKRLSSFSVACRRQHLQPMCIWILFLYRRLDVCQACTLWRWTINWFILSCGPSAHVYTLELSGATNISQCFQCNAGTFSSASGVFLVLKASYFVSDGLYDCMVCQFRKYQCEHASGNLLLPHELSVKCIFVHTRENYTLM